MLNGWSINNQKQNGVNNLNYALIAKTILIMHWLLKHQDEFLLGNLRWSLHKYVVKFSSTMIDNSQCCDKYIIVNFFPTMVDNNLKWFWPVWYKWISKFSLYGQISIIFSQSGGLTIGAYGTRATSRTGFVVKSSPHLTPPPPLNSFLDPFLQGVMYYLLKLFCLSGASCTIYTLLV